MKVNMLLLYMINLINGKQCSLMFLFFEVMETVVHVAEVCTFLTFVLTFSWPLFFYHGQFHFH